MGFGDRLVARNIKAQEREGGQERSGPLGQGDTLRDLHTLLNSGNLLVRILPTRIGQR